jgi:predicted MFS family arabinose efflux permease
MEQTPRTFSSQQIFAIVILSLTQFTVILDFMVMSPLGDLMIKSMGLTPAQFGFAVSAYAFSAGASGFLTAGFADRFDRKSLLMFFYVGFIFGTLLCGLTSSYVMLLSARIVTGIFGGVISSISMAIVTDLFPLEQRGRVMGFLQMGFGTSQVLGIPIGLYVANIWGWQSPFLMIVCLASAIWIGILTTMPAVKKHLEFHASRNAITHLWNTIANRDYRTGFLAMSFLTLGGFMLMPWGSAFAVNNLGVTAEELPVLFMAAGVATLFVTPLIGKLSDRFDKFTLFTWASLFLAVMIVVYTNLTPIPFWLLIVINVVLMMAIMSRVVPAISLATSLPDPEDRGAFMSINSSLQQLSGGAASGIGGLIVVQKTTHSPLEHYDTLGYVIVGVLLIAIFMLRRVSGLVKKRLSR